MDKVSRFDVHPDDVTPADAGEYVTIHDYEALSQQLAATEEKADKFMWQVRDTCVRAEKAEAERDRAVKDAERYRWVRLNDFPSIEVAGDHWQIPDGAELDATIDAAIAAAGDAGR